MGLPFIAGNSFQNLGAMTANTRSHLRFSLDFGTLRRCSADLSGLHG